MLAPRRTICFGSPGHKLRTHRAAAGARSLAWNFRSVFQFREYPFDLRPVRQKRIDAFRIEVLGAL